MANLTEDCPKCAIPYAQVTIKDSVATYQCGACDWYEEFTLDDEHPIFSRQTRVVCWTCGTERDIGDEVCGGCGRLASGESGGNDGVD